MRVAGKSKKATAVYFTTDQIKKFAASGFWYRGVGDRAPEKSAIYLNSLAGQKEPYQLGPMLRFDRSEKIKRDEYYEVIPCKRLIKYPPDSPIVIIKSDSIESTKEDGEEPDFYARVGKSVIVAAGYANYQDGPPDYRKLSQWEG